MPDPASSLRAVEERPVTGDDLDAAERDVEGVDRALQRLDDGCYGTGEVCGARIAADVLAADATVRTCAEHAR